MTPITVRIAQSLTGLLLFAPLLTACGWMGDTGTVKNATELAIDCKTDEALAALEVFYASEG